MIRAALYIDQNNNVVLDNPTTCLSSINVSGYATLNNNATILSSLNISGYTFLNSASTLNSTLNIVGKTTAQDFQVKGICTFPVNNWLVDSSSNQRLYLDNYAKNYYKSGGTSGSNLSLDGHIFRGGAGDLLNMDGYGNITQTGGLLIGGSISCASTLNVASSSNISGNTGVGGNLNISGFLTCGNRWATFSAIFLNGGSGTTYCAGFYFNNYPNLINGKTFLIDGSVTQSGLPTSTSYGFTQIVNNPGVTSSGNVVTKNLYMSSNTVVNWYNSGYNVYWNDGLNVYTYGTSLPTLVCTVRILVLG